MFGYVLGYDTRMVDPPLLEKFLFAPLPNDVGGVRNCNVATPNTAVGIFGGPDTHTCILLLQRNPLTSEESNPVDRKMRERERCFELTRER
ncbi:hypothetical protein TNCV_3459001 [Trichonephila clavipes]|nr:hypothetical protein TNCV_3459001 [Trichonephila clavipes]